MQKMTRMRCRIRVIFLPLSTGHGMPRPVRQLLVFYRDVLGLAGAMASCA